MHRSPSLVLLVVCLLSCTSLQAASVVTAPLNLVLQRDLAGQQVTITIHGDDRVAGMTFSVQIGDGGPGLITQGLIDGPDITGVDLLSGTIFAANNQGVDDPGSYPQFATRTVITNANTTVGLPAAASLLATLTLDTTGVAPGKYDLILGASPSALGTTELYDAFGDTLLSTLINGSVIVVPEPSSVILAGAAIIAAAVAFCRRRRS